MRAFANVANVAAWYLADEPDGAGDLPGAPIGFRSPAAVLEALKALRRVDPTRPALVSLNCLHSPPLYAAAADIVLVDPYPIGIRAENCSPE